MELLSDVAYFGLTTFAGSPGAPPETRGPEVGCQCCPQSEKLLELLPGVLDWPRCSLRKEGTLGPSPGGEARPEPQLEPPKLPGCHF